MRPFARRTKLAVLSFAIFIVALGLSVYIFVEVQVLQSYPFHYLGVWGTQPLFLLTYSQTLELAGPASLVAFASWHYAGSKLEIKGDRIISSIGRTLLFSGALVGATVYAEIHILWGEFWYGLHFWSGLPGGGGYPWGDEQVAYNLCLVKEPSYTPLSPNCLFLNYNGILAIAIAALFIGGVIELYYHSARASRH